MKRFSRQPRPVHRGNMLLQMGIVMGVVLLLAPTAFDRLADQQQGKVWETTAAHLDFVAQAAKHYVLDNRDTLLTQVTGGAVIVTGATLRAQGYLPAGFSLTNDSGQSYQLAITKDPSQAGQLVAFVLTSNGSEIPFKGLREIASDVPGMGGYVSPANVATGADGGWTLNLSDYGLSAQTGHLAAFLSADVLGTDADESDRLYRYQVNGRPDLNRMHTNIDMGGNSLNDAASGTFSGTVTAATGSITGSLSAGANIAATGNLSAGNSATVSNSLTVGNDIRSTNGWVVTSGDKGWYNDTHGGGFYMSDDDYIRALNNKNIYTGGQVRGGSVRSDSDLSAAGVLHLDQVNSAGQACTSIGDVSHNALGATMSCQNYVWVVNGGGQYTYTTYTLNASSGQRKNIVTAQNNVCFVSGHSDEGEAVVNSSYNLYIQDNYWQATFTNSIQQLYVTCAQQQ
ncbi:shufflon system plasmid conjugative transfer pilus tip adhesin PilV [Rahnella sp. BCC 1045]|uniref:shufflon system plasmid conjugative transfer pilus tip adhesin PilV n=1 Tax=Rahnella sp. BCC 1045 TaxID=2816251 RepID=UPI001C26020F|nr:shufflon system plasmid conjugative transfer pilus tip adhesin PilV [Rahnella sp. BCC 1045]MBU9819675.1 shufflon system plasmid conjugative transfer pilus tip adhesin PilV [Rahnella sp. BCC 1045]